MRYATSINDCNLAQWIAINEGGTFCNLYKNKRFRTRKIQVNKELSHLKNAWHSVYDSYLKRYGHDEYYKSIQQKEIQIFKLNCKYIKTGLEHHRTAIRALEQQLYKLKNPNGDNTVRLKLGQILSTELNQLPFYVDREKMKVVEFYDSRIK